MTTQTNPAQHTPTAGPWRVTEHNGRLTIEAPCDYPPKDGIPFVYEIAKLSMVNDQANGEFICRAVNCHEELLALLKEAIARETCEWTKEQWIDWDDRAEALVKRAEGRQA